MPTAPLALAAALLTASFLARTEHLVRAAAPEDAAPLGFLADLALAGTLVAAGAAAERAGRLRRPLLALVAVLAVLGFAVVLVAAQYEMHTGTPLRRTALAYALPRAGRLAPILATGLDRFLAARLLAALTAGWLAARLGRRLAPARPARGLERTTVLAAGPVALVALAVTGAHPEALAPFAARGLPPAPPPASAAFDYRPPAVVGPAPANAPDLLVFVYESTRADLVAPYGPSEAASVTPYLSALAERSIVVERMQAIVPHTSKALVALLCGVPPHPATAIVEAERLSVPCLPALLAAAGYRTAFFQSAHGAFENRRALVRRMGFEHVVTQEDLDGERFDPVGYVAMDERALVEPVTRWIAARRAEGAPVFAVVLSSVPHHPYEPPDPLPPGVPLGGEVAYAAAVHHVDAVFGRLDRALAEGPRPTVRFFVADHGEAFGEHGARQHDAIVYDEVLHVPLVVAGPPDRVGPPRRVAGLFGPIDLLPTVLRLAGVRTRGRLPGRDLLTSSGHDALPAWCWFEGTCAAMVAGGTNTKWVTDAEGRTRRFDLAADPFERAGRDAGEDTARVVAFVRAWQETGRRLHERAPPRPIDVPRARRDAAPPPPQCMAACVADTDPARPGLQPSCRAALVARDGTRTPVPPCEPDGSIPPGHARCFRPRTGDALPARCARRGYNMAVAFPARAPAPPGSVFDVSCKLTPDPAACHPATSEPRAREGTP